MLSVLKIHSLQRSSVVIKKATEYIHHKHCKMLLVLNVCNQQAGSDAWDFT